MGFDIKVPTIDDLPALTLSTQRAFEDYFVPMTITEEGMREFLAMHDIDLSRSVMVVSEQGEVLGQSLTGVRSDRGWIACTGLAMEARGQALGFGMLKVQLDALRAAGVRSVSLEVITRNAQAKRVYEGHGFRRRRDLYCFRHLEPSPGAMPPADHLHFEECNVEAVLDLYRSDNPWQAQAGSLRHMPGTKAFMSFLTTEAGPTMAEGLRGSPTDPHADVYESHLPDIPEVQGAEELLSPKGPELEGYCVYREGEKGVAIIDLYSVANARELLRHAISVTGGKPVHASNMFDGPTVMAFEALGFEMYISQHEMRRDL